jgi:hypothetical protein
VLDGDWLLHRQQLVEPEVLAVALRLAQVPMHLLVRQVDGARRSRGILLAHENIHPGTVCQPRSSSWSSAR